MNIPASFQREVQQFRSRHGAPEGVGHESMSRSDARDCRELYQGSRDYVREADNGEFDLDPQPGAIRRNLMGPQWFDTMRAEGNSLELSTGILQDGQEVLRSLTSIEFGDQRIDTLLINAESGTARAVHLEWGLTGVSGYETREWHIAG